MGSNHAPSDPCNTVTLRQYLPAFMALPFQAAVGSESLLAAIGALRELDAGTRELEPDDPHGFVPAAWRPYLALNGKVDRRIWEISLALAIRDALRAGNLFLAESREHVSFWNLVYDERRWQETRHEAYGRLDLPSEPQAFIGKLATALDRAARAAARGLPSNPFAAVQDGKLKLRQPDALPIPRAVRRLRETIKANMPRVRIEDLLQDVDAWCGFTRAFQPLSGYEPRAGDTYRPLLATLIAHGTNLGLAAMSQSVDSVTAEQLQDINRWFLREATLKAANTILVDHHHRLAVEPGLGRWHPILVRRAALRRRARRPAQHLLSPLLRLLRPGPIALHAHRRPKQRLCHASDLLRPTRGKLRPRRHPRERHHPEIREHTTDTGGFTEPLWGLCVLLGIDFMPRLKDLSDQVLYRVDRRADYGPLNPLLRTAIDIAIIAEQWDQLVRIAASLKDRLTRRMSSSSASPTPARPTGSPRR